jgi:hypothetical protein
MAAKPKWNPIRTVPRDRMVGLKTVTGIECRGRVPKREKVRPADARVKVKRINAHRFDAQFKIGDIRAVAWRSL